MHAASLARFDPRHPPLALSPPCEHMPLANMNLIREGETVEIRYQSQVPGAADNGAAEWRLCTIDSEPGIHARYNRGISFTVTQWRDAAQTDGQHKQFYLSGVLEVRPAPPPSTTGEPSDDSDSDGDDSDSGYDTDLGNWRLRASKRRRLVRAITAAIEEALS
jgi:hypothetical protein